MESATSRARRLSGRDPGYVAPMSHDEQDSAESVDEEMLGAEQATSDEVAVDPAPDEPLGLPFADADVTDESLAEPRGPRGTGGVATPGRDGSPRRPRCDRRF